MTAVNIDNRQGLITTDDDKTLKITINGALKLSDGTYLDEQSSLNEYEGAIRYNNERKCLQLCNGSEWIDIISQGSTTNNVIWSLLF